jgi:hypothetical protein
MQDKKHMDGEDPAWISSTIFIFYKGKSIKINNINIIHIISLYQSSISMTDYLHSDSGSSYLSEFILSNKEYLRNKKKQINVIRYTVKISGGMFTGFTREIEIDTGIFDSMIDSKEVFKTLNNYICNHMYFKLLSFLTREKLNTQLCELNETKDKMSLDVSICTDNEEFIKSKTLVIYVKK